MMSTQTKTTTSREALERERDALRSRLAQAWELREPIDHIHRIEEQMRSLWAQLEAMDEHTPPDERAPVR